MVKILGHRGARGLWTENTIDGFSKAIALGVDMIEFDVHLSADGVPMVMHDPLLDRTSHAKGPIAAQTADDLARIRLRESDETIATLATVLDAVAGSGVELVIEIKTGLDAAPYPNIEDKVLDQVHRRDLAYRTILLSFVPDTLERIRAKDQSVGLIACVWRPQVEFQGGLRPALERVMAIPGAIAAVQEDLFRRNEALCFQLAPPERLAVSVTNEPERLAHWLGRPVRHISTDRPDIALSLRDAPATADTANLRDYKQS
jgi:glycerophosphoryl diester phosphodiesterase